MLKTLLDKAENIKPLERKMDKGQVELICEHNEAIYNSIISDYFEGRNTSCHIGPSTFWVYSDTLSDAQAIKQLARDAGYTNMRTFQPWASNANGERISDPKGAYAVDISNSNELIIGSPAEKLVSILKPIIDPVSDCLVFTYAHLRRANYKFNTASAAFEVHEKLAKLFSMAKDTHEVINMSAIVNQDDGCFDVWVVEVTVN